MAGFVAAAAGEAAAVDPEHDGEFAFGAFGGGGVDVEIEAIFAGAVVLKDHVIEDVILRAVGGVLRSVFDSGPFGDGLGRFPAKVINGRRGIREAEPGADFAAVDGFAVDFALGGFNCERVGGRGGRDSEGGEDARGR